MSSVESSVGSAPVETLRARLHVAELLAAVSCQLLDASPADMGRAIRTALRTVVEALDFERGFLARFSPDHGYFTITQRYGEVPPGMDAFMARPLPRSTLPWLLERKNIVRALEGTEWRVAGHRGAAELLGISPSTLRDRMRSFDVQKPKSD